MDLKELVAKLAEQKAGDVVKALKENATTVYQAIFNAGHGAATEKAKEEQDRLQGELDREKEAREKAETRAKEVEEKTPDAAKIREQFEAQIKSLKEAHKAEKDALEAKGREKDLRRARSDLKASLLSAGVHPDMAAVKAEHPDVVKRIRPADTPQGYEILTDGGDIPIQADDQMKALVSELKGGIDAAWIVSNGDSGSGTGKGAGTGGGGADKDRFEAIRKEAKKGNESGGGGTKLNERFGHKAAAD